MEIKTKITLGTIILILLVTGTVYFTMNNVKMRIDEDQSTFYSKVGSYWMVSGREVNSMWDGTTKMNRDKSGLMLNTQYDEDTKKTKTVRVTPYIRGPIIYDSYEFDGSLSDVELFPVKHEVCIADGKGYIYQYEVRDLVYDGETIKNPQSPLSFGRNMKVEWDSKAYWSTVYKSGILKVRFKPTSDFECYEVRLFDPITCTGNVTNLVTVSSFNSTHCLAVVQPDDYYGKDTYIQERDVPNNNYGGSATLQLRASYPPNYNIFALLYFNISSLGITNSSTISSAIMSMYLYGQGGDDNSASTYLYATDANWNEMTVTWNTGRPGYNTTAISDAQKGTFTNNTYQFYDWVLNSNGYNWLVGDEYNAGYGFYIRDLFVSGGGPYNLYRSSNYTTDITQRPKLTIYYTPVVISVNASNITSTLAPNIASIQWQPNFSLVNWSNVINTSSGNYTWNLTELGLRPLNATSFVYNITETGVANGSVTANVTRYPSYLQPSCNGINLSLTPISIASINKSQSIFINCSLDLLNISQTYVNWIKTVDNANLTFSYNFQGSI